MPGLTRLESDHLKRVPSCYTLSDYVAGDTEWMLSVLYRRNQTFDARGGHRIIMHVINIGL